jgi:hypothetical protein
MSWLYSQVLVEEYLEANSLDGEQSAPSSGNLIPQAYCAPDKMKAHSRLSRFGMTFKPLTDDRGEELLMLFLEDFRAKTLAPQEKEQESKEVAAECGGTWRGLLVKFDQDLLSSKTVLCSEQEDSQRFSKTLPRWGMMRDGECSERTMPGHLISGTECGFLHMMPTPTTAPEAPNKNANTKGPKNLLEIAKTNWMPGEPWPTPTCHNAKEAAYPAEFTRKTPTLTSQAHGGQPTQPMPLNPTWVEWLMGWPLGWTDLKPLETDKFQRWLHSHGNFYQNETLTAETQDLA